MVTQTSVAAFVLWLIFLVHRSRNSGAKQVFGWGFLAGFFTYMAADDGAKIHERMGTVFETLSSPSKSDSADGFFGWLQGIFPSYDWQLVVLPLFVGAGLFMLVLLLREFRDRKRRVLLFLAVGLMASAVVLDFFEGLDKSHPWNVYAWLWEVLDVRKYTVTHFSKSLEEFLEMLSISLLLMMFIRQLIQESDSCLIVDFRGKQKTE